MLLFYRLQAILSDLRRLKVLPLMQQTLLISLNPLFVFDTCVHVSAIYLHLVLCAD